MQDIKGDTGSLDNGSYARGRRRWVSLPLPPALLLVVAKFLA